MIFPKYQPSSLNRTGTTLSSYPGLENLTWYSALEKKPEPAFSFTTAGVLPRKISCPLLSVMLIEALFGVLLIERG